MSLRDQLQSIYNQHGKLTPNVVLDQARDPEHPLHERFEWDDSLAAESWRREQAHQLIRSVKIVYKQADKTGSEKSVRAFHAVNTERGYSYEPAEKVAADPFLTQLVLKDMEREWRALKRRYEQFDEFWTLVRGELDRTAA